MRQSLLTIFCLLGYISLAQDYTFHNISVNDGLSHSDVKSLAYDSSGFIWMGTNNGLNRYDGYRLKSYKNSPSDTNSLPDNRIAQLIHGNGDVFYSVSESNILSSYDQKSDRFISRKLNLPAQSKVKEIIFYGSETIWMWTSDNEIYRASLNTLPQVELVSLPFEGQISSMMLYENSLLIGSFKHGLWQLSLDKDQLKFEKWTDHNAILRLALIDEGIFLATPAGLFELDANQKSNRLIEWQFTSETVMSDLVFDYKGDVWLALFNGGVYHYINEGNTSYKLQRHYSSSYSLGTNRINDLMIDDFNVLWIATSGAGAYYIDLLQKPFEEISESVGFDLPENYTTAILEHNSDLLIGTRKGLVTLFSPFEEKKMRLDMPDKHISYLMYDDNNQLWLGTRFSGLFIKNDQGFKKIEGLNSDEVIGIDQDGFGRIWVITFDDGAYLYSSKEHELIKHIGVGEGLPTNALTYIYIDNENNEVWLSSRDKGLINIEIRQPETFRLTNYQYLRSDSLSISSNYLWPILKSKSGHLWVGAIGGGLNKMNRSGDGYTTFTRYMEEDGLPDNDIESILEDNQGNLWLGGRGLTRFSPDHQNAMVTYDYYDGLQSNSFKIGAAHRNKGGMLYFGGINGINHFDPAKISANPITPRIIFDELRVFNQTVGVGTLVNGRVLLPSSLDYLDQLTFRAEENEFSIDMLGIHYSNPLKKKYSYYLKGFNRDWIETKERKVTFANLKPGDYTFRAKVANSDGIWSAEKKITITILPPWWLSWWALLSYGLLIFGLLYLYRFLMIKRSELLQDVNLANSEAKEREEKLALFTNISHEIRTPLTLIKAPIEELLEESNPLGVSEKLILVNKNVNRLLKLCDQLLDFRKMDTGNMDIKVAEGDFSKYVKEVFSVFKLEAQKKQIEFAYHSISDNIRVTFDRDKFEIVVTNLLINALKYTQQGGRIELKISLRGDVTKDAEFKDEKSMRGLLANYVILEVVDNGSGMTKENLTQIFDRFYQVKTLNQLDIQGTGIGLSLVKEIINMHHGEVEVSSALGQGTCFKLLIPCGQNHFSEEHIIKEFRDSENLELYKYSDEDSEVFDNNSDLTKSLILVVEDNLEVAKYIINHLNRSFRTIHAANGVLGLKKAEKYLPDLIISDVMMPEMDGIEMISAINQNPDLSFIPVILLTARTSSVYELQGVETGAYDYITKPFSLKVLLAKVSNILKARANFKKCYEKGLRSENVPIDLPNAEVKFLEQITKIVSDNMTNEDFSVSELVKQVGMSQSSCYKRIKQLTDRSAVQFIRDVRLKKAAELLIHGNLTVSQVAYSVGINDQKFFREKFKNLFGMNPSEYLKTMDKKRST